MQASIKLYLDRIFPTEGFEFQYEVQSLWSGYGSLQRWASPLKSIIVKYIQLASQVENNHGWGGSFAHQRKLKSYAIEAGFYKNYANQLPLNCKVPQLLGLNDRGNFKLLVLEDLKISGFQPINSAPNEKLILAVLRWLATFHAKFVNNKSADLWLQGTYWHLTTRPEELKAMPSGSLKKKAFAFDSLLLKAKHKTLVHGDAKLANFLSTSSNEVAGVDFQYVGGGVGVVDVMYFFSSCLSDSDLEKNADGYLAMYFYFLKEQLNDDVVFDALKLEWQQLYVIAWADFSRFLEGWRPGHWKLGNYAAQKTTEAIKMVSK